ncbi:MAG: hypothetical protein KJO02_07175 [Erythrobacter sp.]|nr:hypothetical protein [Erythrobacter sp.]NNC48359.1 hypothetical protein [Sphingomonas sp.]NNC53701.1 hypothetical protein [Erythrobacter sp.]
MKKTILIATLPVALALSACGDPIDGSDTADLSSDATTVETGDEDAGAYNPSEDGMLQSDGLVDDTPVTTEESLEEYQENTEEAEM